MKELKPETIEKNMRLYNRIKDELIRHQIPAHIHKAKTNNIVLLVHHNNIQYSVVRFAYTRSFRIFYPFARPNQTRVDRKQWYEVVDYFTARN